AAPKKFAAGIGMVFAFAIAGSLFLQWTWTAGILSGVLLFCALLESALSYCVGCVVYALLQRFLLKAQA
ncbi:MAG: DUF4395 family protein, partial [Saprospiraceae bacterium]|nr:DUF4395 family protein [Saprospiraceae bacterium]